ncbi:MAG: LacI family DNA-binding transcriptional regulator [Betaproteobacteria bacterium]|jgi:LacI family gluconate utilization system Gnt-I transcriptional repressor
MNDKETQKRTRRGSGAITLRDVAMLAGVAPITASRALNTPSQVSDDVLRKVQEAVDRTGYVPNRMAGGLASSKSRLIAAVVPSTVFSVFNETIEALNGALFESGYQLMLGQTGYSSEREELLLESVISRRPDGIFITGIMPPGKARTRLMASGIPVVETWDLTPTPIDMLIGFSHADIGQAVAQYLLSKGNQKYAIVTADDERAGRRNKAFIETVKAHKSGDVLVQNVGDLRTLKSGREALKQILLLKPDVDAIFCSSDLLALGVLTEARAQKISVPHQISIMGFGDVPFVEDMIPALTTVKINGAEIGRLAAQCLVDRAQGKAVEQHIVDVGFSIVSRESA